MDNPHAGVLVFQVDNQNMFYLIITFLPSTFMILPAMPMSMTQHWCFCSPQPGETHLAM